jgi:hypothetical protein
MVTPVEETCEFASSRPAGTVPPSNRRFPCRARAGRSTPELVDEPVLEQRLDQVCAAVHLQLGAVLLLERAEPVGQLAFDQLSVLPLELGERGRGHVMGAAKEVANPVLGYR